MNFLPASFSVCDIQQENILPRNSLGPSVIPTISYFERCLTTDPSKTKETYLFVLISRSISMYLLFRSFKTSSCLILDSEIIGRLSAKSFTLWGMDKVYFLVFELTLLYSGGQ